MTQLWNAVAAAVVAARRIRNRVYTLMLRGFFEQFGERSIVEPPLRISRGGGISVGNDVYIGQASWLQTLSVDQGGSERPQLQIGNGCRFAGFDVVSSALHVLIEADVLLARNVYISDHSHRIDRPVPIHLQGVDRLAPVRIGRGAWLGQNVVVCPGVSIGEGAVVGANSVVTHDVPPFAVAAGAPARMIRTIEIDSQDHREEATTSSKG